MEGWTTFLDWAMKGGFSVGVIHLLMEVVKRLDEVKLNQVRTHERMDWMIKDHDKLVHVQERLMTAHDKLDHRVTKLEVKVR